MRKNIFIILIVCCSFFIGMNHSYAFDTNNTSNNPILLASGSDDTSDVTCDSVLGGFADELAGLLKIMRIAAPLLVFFLSLYDYMSAIFNKDDDALKKANSKLVKRLVLAISLFLLPVLLNILLGLVDPAYTTCVN